VRGAYYSLLFRLVATFPNLAIILSFDALFRLRGGLGLLSARGVSRAPLRSFHILLNLLKVLQVVADDLDLGCGVGGSIGVTVKAILGDYLVVVLGDLVILHVLGVIVEAGHLFVLAIVLELLEFTEALEVVDSHEQLRQHGDLFKLGGGVVLQLVLQSGLLVVNFFGLHFELGNLVVQLHAPRVLLVFVLGELGLHRLQVVLLVLQRFH